MSSTRKVRTVCLRTLNYQFYRYSEYAGKMHDYFRYGKYGDNEKEYTKKEFSEHLERNNRYILK
jgi:uncharacterized LabA/DUF88 family protein